MESNQPKKFKFEQEDDKEFHSNIPESILNEDLKDLIASVHDTPSKSEKLENPKQGKITGTGVKIQGKTVKIGQPIDLSESFKSNSLKNASLILTGIYNKGDSTWVSISFRYADGKTEIMDFPYDDVLFKNIVKAENKPTSDEPLDEKTLANVGAKYGVDSHEMQRIKNGLDKYVDELITTSRPNPDYVVPEAIIAPPETDKKYLTKPKKGAAPLPEKTDPELIAEHTEHLKNMLGEGDFTAIHKELDSVATKHTELKQERPVTPLSPEIAVIAEYESLIEEETILKKEIKDLQNEIELLKPKAARERAIKNSEAFLAGVEYFTNLEEQTDSRRKHISAEYNDLSTTSPVWRKAAALIDLYTIFINKSHSLIPKVKKELDTRLAELETADNPIEIDGDILFTELANAEKTLNEQERKLLAELQKVEKEEKEKGKEMTLSKDQLESEIQTAMQELIAKPPEGVTLKIVQPAKLTVRLGSGLFLHCVIEAKKKTMIGGLGGNIQFTADLGMQKGDIAVVNYSITAGMGVEGPARKAIAPEIPKLIPAIKAFLSQKYGDNKEVKNVTIENGNLTVVFEK